MGPPWPVDVLADLHAGVLDADVADELWPRVRDDPEAAAVLDALDATIAELGGLSAAQMPPMPMHQALRLDRALAEETRAAFPAPPLRSVLAPAPGMSQPPAPVVDLAQARGRRNQRIGWAAGVLVVAAAVAAVVVVALPRGEPGIGEAAPPPTTSQAPGGAASSGPLRLTTTTLRDSAVALDAIGRSDYGPLSPPPALTACLRANGVQGGPIGGMQVVLNGRPGTLLVLTTGHLAQYRVLVVAPNCSADTPDQLADIVVGEPNPPTH
jgi:hypothetical protein